MANSSAGANLHATAQKVQRVLDAAIADGLQVVAVLDPASHASAWKQFGALAAARGGGSLFRATPQPQDSSVAPLLLPLQAGDEATHIALTRIALATPAVVWVASSLRVQRLAPLLSGKLSAELADGGRSITLRYYDPRVLPELQVVFDPVQRAHLNEGIACWWWLDRRNELADLAPEATASAGNSSVSLRPSISLSDEQVEALLSASFVDRVLDLLMRSTPQALLALDRAERHAMGTTLVEQAAVWHLTSEFDCANYVALALQHGQDFATHPDWIGAMSNVKAGRLNFSDAIGLWEQQHADSL